MTTEGTDIRTQLGHSIIRMPSGVYKIIKTTRAGASTSIGTACLDSGKKFLALVPTNKIADKTFVQDVPKYSKNKNYKIIHIPSNFECIMNQEMIAEQPEYKKLKFLPLADKCDCCDYFEECPVTEILRVEDFDGIVMTYHKIIAIKLAAEMYLGSTAAIIMQKLEDIGIIIYDEAHDLAFDKILTIDSPDYQTILNLKNKLDQLNKTGKYDVSVAIIQRFLNILKDSEFLETKERLYEYFLYNNLNWYENKHSIKIKNNNYEKVICSKEINNKYTNENEIIEIDASNVSMELINELMELFPVCKNYKIDLLELVSIFNMLEFVISENINLKATRKYDKEDIFKYTLEIQMSVTDTIFNETITDFTQSMQTDFRQFFLVSATFPDFDFSKFFLPGTKIEDILFGKNGDSFNTNSKMAIFCDKKSFSAFGKYSTKMMENYIFESCLDIFNIYGLENCLIIHKNKLDADKMAERLQEVDEFKKYIKYEESKENGYFETITYYRSSDMMGVPSQFRVVILIGLAYIPSDAYDSVCETVQKSRILSEERMHCDSWQAISRVKDPQGIEPSVVFALGCRKQDVENVVLWGAGQRKIEIMKSEKGKKTEKKVTVSGEKVSTPNIYEIRDWNETLVMSMVHMFGLSKTKGIQCYGCSKLRNNLIKNEITVNSKFDLLDEIFGETKYKTQYKYDSRNYSKKDVQINKSIISEHLAGSKNYYFRPVLNRKTNVISFETDSKINLCKLKLFFDSNDVPHVIEKLDNNFRLWIFIKETTVTDAKKIVYSAFDEVGNKEFKVNLSNELIKMPFGKDSEILIDGEFVNEFTKLNIEIVDTTDFDKPFKLNLMSTDNESEEDEGSRFCA